SSVTRAGGGRPAKDQRSPLRRCFKPRPLLRAECAGFASGCRSITKKVVTTLSGGCPASCPDTYRPTHGHRHVRNWAGTEIWKTDRECKSFQRAMHAIPKYSLRRCGSATLGAPAQRSRAGDSAWVGDSADILLKVRRRR